MKCLNIYRIAAAAIALCAAIAVADVAAANVRYQPTTGTVPSPSPSPGALKVSLDTVGESDGEPDCDGDTGGGNFAIIIAVPIGQNVTVHFGTADGTATAGQDYNRVVRGTLTIPAGRTTATGKVTIRPDRVATQKEYFYVRIFEPSLGEIGTSHCRMQLPLS